MRQQDEGGPADAVLAQSVRALSVPTGYGA